MAGSASIQMVTLYGKGAITVHGDQRTYRPEGGKITVPRQLMGQVMALGWSTEPPADAESDIISLASGAVIALEAGAQIAGTIEGPATITGADAEEAARQAEYLELTTGDDPLSAEEAKALVWGDAQPASPPPTAEASA